MKVVQINAVTNLSTGKIASAICDKLNSTGEDECYFLYSYGDEIDKPRYEKFLSRAGFIKNKIGAFITGKRGFVDKHTSKKVLFKIKEINPDIVHIHNIHNHDFDVETFLFGLKNIGCKVVYTFHDTWFMTGYCPFSEEIGCEEFKRGCERCPVYKDFSFFFDKSMENQLKKIRSFNQLQSVVVTPCVWLENLVHDSLLKIVETHVIYNGINPDIFSPKYDENIYSKYGLKRDKYVLLVASVLEARKGVKDVLELSNHLDENVRVVIVGYNQNHIDFSSYKNVIHIERTDNQEELASLYSGALCFVNPTYAEIFCLVNIESLACGTPVLTYNTAGCPELITDKCGEVIKKGDVEALTKAVNNLITKKTSFSKEDCVKRAKEFTNEKMVNEYIKLYKQLLSE